MDTYIKRMIRIDLIKMVQVMYFEFDMKIRSISNLLNLREQDVEEAIYPDFYGSIIPWKEVNEKDKKRHINQANFLRKEIKFLRAKREFKESKNKIKV